MPGRTSTKNHALLTWVDDMARLLKPARIVWCDGSEAEKRQLAQEAADSGVSIPPHARKRPATDLHRSDPEDKSSGKRLVFVCTPTKEEAGPMNHWMAPSHAYQMLRNLLFGAMTGRTMYVIPYAMQPAGSPVPKFGVELTDSLCITMWIQDEVRTGKVALDLLSNATDFDRGVHAVHPASDDVGLICVFPQDNTIWSIGDDDADDALLPKWLARR